MMERSLMSWIILVGGTAVLSQLMAGVTDASNSGPGHGPQNHNVPTFDNVEELCEWLCQRQSPHYNYGCPPSCNGGVLDSWSKRAARGRRFDDFSFGFDDYLFMKLLGRKLNDRS